MAKARVRARFSCGETHAGNLRHEDGVLVQILPPATRKLYWRGLREQRVEVIDVAGDARLPAELLAKLQSVALRPRAVQGLEGVLLVQVPEFHAGVSDARGADAGNVAAGEPRFLALQPVRWPVTCGGPAFADRRGAAGQENPAPATRWACGLNLSADVALRRRAAGDGADAASRPSMCTASCSSACARQLGEQTLDALLENKAAIDQTVLAQVRERLEGSGVALESVGVKDIILPGEMKTILAQVVEAEKSAQANVIRRREETAATRSLLNTAKVMEGNPVALRMKELETLERVAERIDKISVVGGLDQVLNGLVTLRPNGS